MNTWIPIGEALPQQREVVICGHSHGQWIERDILFYDGEFRKRVNGTAGKCGGLAGYKQTDTKTPDGLNIAGPDDWLWGHVVRPTHWSRYPNPPVL